MEKGFLYNRNSAQIYKLSIIKISQWEVQFNHMHMMYNAIAYVSSTVATYNS